MNRLTPAVAASVAVLFAVPATAQDHSMANMPGMSMPAPAKKALTPKKAASKTSVMPKPAARKTTRVVRKSPATAPASTSMAGMPGMAGMDHSVKGPAQSGQIDHGAMAGMKIGGGSASATIPRMDRSPPDAAAGGQGHGAMPGMKMSGSVGLMPGMDQAPMAGMPMQPVGTALPAGDAPAPPPPRDHYADRQFAPAEMARARHEMMREEGGRNLSRIMFNLAEVQIRDGKDGYRWDGEGWFGGDINRLTVKTQGEGAFHEGVDSAEVQVLYSRAVGPFFNLQAGVRHDFQPSPTRTYATVGFEGLAPYWFEVEGALFLSNKGDVLGRLEGYYDQRLTQRLILQPRVELNLSAQDVPENRLGAGLTNAELGLRLRYEISRQFAPYVGVSYDAKTGRTADFARAAGKKPTSTSAVAGVRFWF